MLRFAVIVFFATINCSHAATSYRAIELAQPIYRPYTIPVSINDAWQVVGNSSFSKAAYDAGLTNAVFWPDTQTTILMNRDGDGAETYTKAHDMNIKGEIVGEYKRRSDGYQALAFWYNGMWQWGTMVRSLLDPETNATRAFGIDDYGNVVGETTLATGPSWALQFRSVFNYDYADNVLYPYSTEPRPLTKNEKAVDINNNGMIVGEIDNKVFFIDAYGLSANVFSVLYFVNDVNEQSHILAHYQNGCYIYDRAGGQDSNYLNFSNAYCVGKALNNNNEMVGYYQFHTTGNKRAFVYKYDIRNNVRLFNTLDQITLFNHANVILTHAEDINNYGYIIAGGYRDGVDDPNTVKRTYLLIPQ